MPVGRYGFTRRIVDGRAYSTADTFKIYQAVENGLISCNTLVLEQSQRLDHLAGVAYNSSSYWWVIAAASGIGWGLQVPPGTIIRIPSQLNDVFRLIS